MRGQPSPQIPERRFDLLKPRPPRACRTHSGRRRASRSALYLASRARRRMARQAVARESLAFAATPLRRSSLRAIRERRLERETGIEPATNSLEGCDSTTELLPPFLTSTATTTHAARRRSKDHCPLRTRCLPQRPASQTKLEAVFIARRRPSGLGALACHERGQALPFDSLRHSRGSGSPESIEGRSLKAPFDLGLLGRVEWWGGEDSNLRRRLADRFTVCCI